MRRIYINITNRKKYDANGYVSFEAKGRDFVFDGITPDPIYALSSLMLNYDITTSTVTSMLELSIVGGMPESDDIIRSGQYIQVEENTDGTDNKVIFQGIVLTPNYVQSRVGQGGLSQLMLSMTLAPSIYQFAAAPLFFSNKQANQISKLLDIKIIIALVGKTQLVKVSDFFDGIVQNTDYGAYFNKQIKVSDIDETNVYTIAGTGESIDSVVRQTLSYYNTVFYQQEDGTIIVRQLDPSIESPFDIDLNNQNVSESPAKGITPVAPLLEWEYVDNACLTPSVVSGYNIITPNIASTISTEAAKQNALKTKTALPSFPLIVSYRPNYDYYPAMGDLIKTGWFVGSITNTQINGNVVSDAAVATIVKNFFGKKEQYLVAADPDTLPVTVDADKWKNVITAYQQLMTTKELATLLSRYSTVSGMISLDDPNLAGVDLSKIVGTCIQIGNCDMKSGIIATCSRIYSIGTPYLAITVLPLGSITGFWKDPLFQPTFSKG